MSEQDFNDHNTALAAIKESQNASRDIRLAVKEQHNFADKRDGQWEPDIINRMRGKPRYTDDRVNPIINQIAGDLENADFSIKVDPAGGNATKQLAKVRDGVIRNIRNLSNAEQIFSQAGRKMVKGGFAAWMIDHDYFDDDSFDQDLLIKPIHDAHERVWLDPYDLTNDGSDAKWGVVYHFISKEDYKAQFPDKHPQSLTSEAWTSSYYYTTDYIIIGHFYYLKPQKTQLFKMSNGAVYKQDEIPETVLEQLDTAGITVTQIREVEQNICHFRMLDAKGWLSDEEKTIFSYIPIVPVYGNFEVAEGKLLYRGAVEKLIDMQRVRNYAVSRNVEEVALAPRKKIVMTKEQIEGNKETVRTLNTNMDPVLTYNAQGNVPPPFEIGGPQANPALLSLIQQSDDSISRTAGLFAANMGDNPNLQSGVAIDKQIARGNNGTSVYFAAMEVAISRTGYMLNKTMPIVYDATRQMRLLKEDGGFEMTILNNVVRDPLTNQDVTLNDLTQGKYDVTCDVGPAYKNRQQEANEMFARAMEKDPSLMQIGGDIWMNNIAAPGFDLLSERLRSQAFNNGMIPYDQMTEEEQQEQQQREQQPQQPSVEEMQMQVAMMDSETANLRERNIASQHQIKMQEIEVNAQQARQKTESKLAVDAAKVEQTQQRIDLEAQRLQLDEQSEMFKQLIQLQQNQLAKVDSLANTVKNLSDMIGADVIISPPAVKAMGDASEKLSDTLDNDL